MADLEALFFSDNFLKTVDPDHENFIDLSTFWRVITEEDVVIDGRQGRTGTPVCVRDG
ncbi:hypothetical protein ACFW2I_38415 [Streptomyces nigra]|uniref:hypothetical protein n=1 Tax=Streptomyces nigra TaxID=1827580 RepID=UPI00369F056B